MNILGEGFPKEIIEQVEQRQKIYGSGYIGVPRTPEEIVFLNGNTSWCKLVSSVDIVDPKSVKNETVSSLNLRGNELAKQFVLFNGVTADQDGQRSGISYDKSILGGNNAYSIGGTEFGIRPMMGIQNASIKHENRGSIRRATVKIKAWNKKQFDIIDILYLRLGFDILLEWGHAMYYDNKGELHTNENNSLATEFLAGKGSVNVAKPMFNIITNQSYTTTKLEYTTLTYEDFLQLIQNQRLSSYGNYDAMFAKVTNFHWSFMPDGSYDIDLDLVSIGDVMESFKINTLTSGLPKDNTSKVWTDAVVAQTAEDITKLNDTQLIALFANKHSIGQWFYTLTGPNIAQQQANIAPTTQAIVQSAVNKGFGPREIVDERGIVRPTRAE